MNIYSNNNSKKSKKKKQSWVNPFIYNPFDNKKKQDPFAPKTLSEPPSLPEPPPLSSKLEENIEETLFRK